MYTIRPFEKTDSDYETIVAIINAERPDEATTVDVMKYEDERRPTKFPYQRDLILCDGEAVGLGVHLQTETSNKANKYIFDCLAHPDHKNDHAVSQCYLDYVLGKLADTGIDALSADTREDRPEMIKFFEANDFTQVMRYPISKLDVEAFDFTRYDDAIKRTLDSGIEIVSVADMQREHPDDYNRLYYDVQNAVLKDVPMPDEFIPNPLEVFTQRMFEHPEFMPEAHFFARENGDYVGLSCLWKYVTDPEKLGTGLTGVLRSHRRRGVATALKVHAIQFAKQYGAKMIKTDNEENNPMYDLNMQLGFTPLPAYLDFEKALK